MKRFIDLRGQMAGGRFAWWDTAYDQFEWHRDEQSMAWDTWDEFAADYNADERHAGNNELERYRALVPRWVFERTSKDEIYQDIFEGELTFSIKLA